MIHWLEYNGVNSLDMGVYIRDKTALNKPEKNIEFISVPGRNGDLVVDYNNFKNLDVTYQLRLIVPSVTSNAPDDFDYYYNAVAYWLQQTANYTKLIDSYNPGYYRLGAIRTPISLQFKSPRVADFDITFSCKPHKYRSDGESTITITQTGTPVYNPEPYSSAPLLIIYTNGEQVDNDTYTFSIVPESSFSTVYKIQGINNMVRIDSDMMNVYKGNTNMNRNYLSDEFPILRPGKNIIFLGQGISKIDIIPRWRTI